MNMLVCVCVCVPLSALGGVVVVVCTVSPVAPGALLALNLRQPRLHKHTNKHRQTHTLKHNTFLDRLTF